MIVEGALTHPCPALPWKNPPWWWFGSRSPLSRDSTRHRTGLDLLPSDGPTSPSWRLFTTAELNRERIAKAVLHLAATMQFCGFRSVIGTKWAIADTDRRDLDGNSYD